jgi:hypothetical protein
MIKLMILLLLIFAIKTLWIIREVKKTTQPGLVWELKGNTWNIKTK